MSFSNAALQNVDAKQKKKEALLENCEGRLYSVSVKGIVTIISRQVIVFLISLYG